MESYQFTKESNESFYINYKPFIYKIMIELAFRLEKDLKDIKPSFTPEKLTADLQSIIEANGGIAKIQEGIFNCGI